jgi:hypothetical protein
MFTEEPAERSRDRTGSDDANRVCAIGGHVRLLQVTPSLLWSGENASTVGGSGGPQTVENEIGHRGDRARRQGRAASGGRGFCSLDPLF